MIFHPLVVVGLQSVEPLSGEVVRRAVAQRFHTLVVAERVRWADDGVKVSGEAGPRGWRAINTY